VGDAVGVARAGHGGAEDAAMVRRSSSSRSKGQPGRVGDGEVHGIATERATVRL
jgi:hypothetical protein